MKILCFYPALCILLASTAFAGDAPTVISLKTDVDTLSHADKRLESVSEADWQKHITLAGDPNATDEMRHTLLHCCADRGLARLCRFLISRGGNVNAPDGEGKTPPMMYRGKDVTLWDAFFEAGLDVQHADSQGNTLLHRRWDTPPDVLRRLVEAGADINATNQEGMTPLGVMASCSYATPELVRVLLDAGADVNLYKEHSPLPAAPGRSPLAAAVERESAIIAHVLLDAGADVNDLSVRDYIVLYHAANLWDMDLIRKMLARVDDARANSMKIDLIEAAARCGNRELCALMIEQGVDINARNTMGVKSILRAAIQGNQLEMVRFLLEKGVQVELAPPKGKPHSASLRDSPLAMAVQTGNIELCRLLVRHGARFFDDEYDHKMLIHHAAYTGDVEMCRYVANFNADMNVRMSWGATPLHIAAERQNYELCVFLLSRGADVNAKDDKDRTPLHMVIGVLQPYGEYRAGLRVTKLLMDAGADMQGVMGSSFMNTRLATRFLSKQMQLRTRQFPDGQKPDVLLLAAYAGDARHFQWLLDGGKDPAVKDADGESAIHYAVRGGNAEMVKHLLATGVNPDTRGLYSATPLHCAAALGHTDIIELLADAGADINARDEHYEATPLLWALGDSQGECVKTLVRRGAGINFNNRLHRNAFTQALFERKYAYCDFFVQSGYDLNEAVKAAPMNLIFNGISMNHRTLEDLKRYGLDFTTRDAAGHTLLHYIFQQRDDNADIRYLLENGGMECVTMKDAQGKTPLDPRSPSGNESLRNKTRYILREIEKQ